MGLDADVRCGWWQVACQAELAVISTWSADGHLARAFMLWLHGLQRFHACVLRPCRMHAGYMLTAAQKQHKGFASLALVPTWLARCWHGMASLALTYLWQQVAEQLLHLDLGCCCLAPPQLNMPVGWEHQVPSALLSSSHAQHVLRQGGGGPRWSQQSDTRLACCFTTVGSLP